MTFSVTFWGVRGSIACSGDAFARYGGNTACVEAQIGGTSFILDAGTGLMPLGRSMTGAEPAACHLLLSHAHWDHIGGFPFFAPCYDPRWRIHVHAGNMSANGGVRQVLMRQMSALYFPVPLSAMAADIRFADFDPGETLILGDGVTVRTAPLNHPGGCTGYRLEWRGKSLAYITDNEVRPGSDDPALAVMQDVDLVLFDAAYTEADEGRKGWSHSTWQDGVRLARVAGAKKLVLIHHDAAHDDAIMDRIEREAQDRWPHASAARESANIVL
ncbi:MBL fold metallo-hydrolase [Ensifer adhaerens]|uniref:MBL fold metallo-hydrolase n=1 Tax=Ensifer adhaerens TaxID=106592 RepID=UPI000CF19A7E|nr:MBL fold metallo-hydrolase [Ensifer adhaerens]